MSRMIGSGIGLLRGTRDGAGTAAIDAELDHRGDVPLERAHDRPPTAVVVDLPQVLEWFADGHPEDARELLVSDYGGDDRPRVIDGMAAVRQQLVERAAERFEVGAVVDDVGGQAVDRIDRRL